MVITKEFRKQLAEAGFKNGYWGWGAIRQLPSLLEYDEVVERVISGIYEGGHAVIVATNKRMIFMDKKVMSFKVEDIHYEMVSEVEHRTGMIMARLRVRCVSNSIELNSMSHSGIREFARYLDAKVNKLRLNMRTWEQMMQQDQRGLESQKPASYPRPGSLSRPFAKAQKTRV